MVKSNTFLFDLLKVSLFEAEVDALLIQTATVADWKEIRKLAERQDLSTVVFDSLDKLRTKDYLYELADGRPDGLVGADKLY